MWRPTRCALQPSVAGCHACPCNALALSDTARQASLDAYASRVRSNDENQEFLEAHPEVLHEHGMGCVAASAAGASGRSSPLTLCARPLSRYLLMEALTLGMAGKLVRRAHGARGAASADSAARRRTCAASCARSIT